MMCMYCMVGMNVKGMYCMLVMVIVVDLVIGIVDVIVGGMVFKVYFLFVVMKDFKVGDKIILYLGFS